MARDLEMTCESGWSFQALPRFRNAPRQFSPFDEGRRIFGAPVFSNTFLL